MVVVMLGRFEIEPVLRSNDISSEQEELVIPRIVLKMLEVLVAVNTNFKIKGRTEEGMVVNPVLKVVHDPCIFQEIVEL